MAIYILEHMTYAPSRLARHTIVAGVRSIGQLNDYIIDNHLVVKRVIRPDQIGMRSLCDVEDISKI